ncbi:NERD domain-containing protein [Litchfieldia alkalitelluris]|uniref:NERD domain-containing protein n=1 Tax=Litchfieldia alkalitelluris TaxID=304268 RepID=UPI000995EC9A|nr:NERD domain-containing protein [Litchfieldia alkalitelluris]
MELILFVLIIGVLFVLKLPGVKGFIGEKSVSYLLSKLDKNTYTVKNDIILHKKGGKTTQIDHVVISRYGIFVIETKNYKGWIFGSEKSSEWTQTIYNRKHKFYNPLYQNYSHIKGLQNFLDLEDDILYHSIVAFSPRATLKNIDIKSERVNVVYTTKLLEVILQYKKPILTDEQVRRITTRLSFIHKPDKEMKTKHVTAIKSTLQTEREMISSNQCPKCAAQLVQRVGKYGPFTGCSNYPKCKYIVKKEA